MGGLAHQRHPSPDAELGQQRGDMKLYGALAQAELCGNLLVREIPQDAFENLALPRRSGTGQSSVCAARRSFSARLVTAPYERAGGATSIV